jgi:hypothetical protein
METGIIDENFIMNNNKYTILTLQPYQMLANATSSRAVTSVMSNTEQLELLTRYNNGELKYKDYCRSLFM